MSIKVGCCGFARGQKEYFDHFRLVEVQQTFYKPPQVATARRWRQQAPPGFEFTLKAWQLITHPPSSPTYRRAGLEIPASHRDSYGLFRPTDQVWQAWRRTEEIAEALEARVIVFQCPASFSDLEDNIRNMSQFFRAIDRKGFLFAWEPRGQWARETIRGLCQELGLVHCVDPFEAEPLSPGMRYLRLHGGPGYRHHYSDEELGWLRGRLGEGENYVLFNNLSMYEDALRFMEQLKGRP
ncbi:MAG TPA: DUF72 domain-containing protein [Dehalococcoidia bacterium]|nr:DUF72 domain-containing protein [Dehalococcoidia bacterium]